MNEEPKPDSQKEEEPQFIGTLFVLMIYIMFTAGMWFAVYRILFDR